MGKIAHHHFSCHWKRAKKECELGHIPARTLFSIASNDLLAEFVRLLESNRLQRINPFLRAASRGPVRTRTKATTNGCLVSQHHHKFLFIIADDKSFTFQFTNIKRLMRAHRSQLFQGSCDENLLLDRKS